jgi:hypothetical protein
MVYSLRESAWKQASGLVRTIKQKPFDGEKF